MKCIIKQPTAFLWVAWLALCFLTCLVGRVGAQVNLTSMEYYIDTDPGYGNATPIAFTAANSVVANVSIPTTSLTSGIHIVGIRTKDANGAWGLDAKYLFVNPGVSTTLATVPNLQKFEYYVDTDPGYGNATNIPFTAGTTATPSFSIPTSSLSSGVHIVGIRAQDANNAWGLDAKYLFINPGTTTTLAAVPNLQKFEYYVDTDPGYGNATSIPFTAGTSASPSVAIPTGSLSSGVHIVGIRAQDANGAWGLDAKYLFVNPGATTTATPVPALQKFEYYVDTDPGYGNATNIPFTAGTSASPSFSIPTTSLSSGIHIVGIRAQDANGAWGLDAKYLFINPGATTTLATVPNLIRTEYYIDTDPGYGNGTPISFTPGTSAITAVALPVGSFTDGTTHTVGIRSQDANGAWSLDYQYTFKKEPGPIVNNISVTGCNSVVYKGNTYTSSTVVKDTTVLTSGQDSINVVTITINTPAAPTVSIAASPTGAVCAGTLVTLLATAQNGGSSPTYSWTVNGNAVGSNAATYSSSSFANGDVVVCTLTSNATCVTTATAASPSFVAQINPNPTVTVTAPSSAVCFGNSVVLTASGASTYTWSPSGSLSASTGTQVTASPTSNTTYTVTGVNGNGCQGTGTISITVSSAAPTITNLSPSGCGSVLYNGVTYTSSTVKRDTTFTGGGCISTITIATITVTTPVVPSVSISANPSGIVCTGSLVTLTANTQNAGNLPSYSWTKNGVVVNTSSAVYSSSSLANGDVVVCTLTSSATCVTSSTASSPAFVAQIASVPTITVTAPTNTVCSGSPVVLTASGATSYSWSPYNSLSSSTGAQVTATPTSNTTYTVTGNNGCTATGSISIDVNALPNVSAGSNQTINQGSAVTLMATGATSYAWSTGDDTSTIQEAPQTTTTYTVTGTGSNGCSATSSVTVNVNFSSLSIANSIVNFGNVVVSYNGTSYVGLNNNGTQPVTISSATVFGTGFGVVFSPQTINAGGNYNVQLSFAPTQLLYYSGSLSLVTSIGNFVVGLIGKGVAPAPAWSLSSTLYSYNNVQVGSTAHTTINITNTGNIPISLGSITSDNAVFSASSSLSSLTVGQSATLTNNFTPSSVGSFTGNITIPSTTSGLASLTLGLSGNGFLPNTPPTLQLVSVTPYSGTTGVSPTVGPAGSYTYRVVYTSSSNLAPLSGSPAIGIDYNGDGLFNGTNEGIFPMNQVGSTSNWTTGETFTFTTTLPIGSTYGYQFFAKDANGNPATGSTSYTHGPVVTTETLDLSIFANDITFSIAHPSDGESFIVHATVHNNTPYSASNIPVAFYDNSGNLLATATPIPFMGPYSTYTVSVPMSFGTDGFYPIEAWVDYANTLHEVDRLNNYAIRPITVGLFSIPAAIIVNSSPYTQSCPSPAVTISGNAYYDVGTPGYYPPVLGATVTVNINGSTGNTTLSTYTITNGNWSVNTPLSCGIVYSYTVSVTDYTLTGNEASQSFTIACSSCSVGSSGGGGGGSGPVITCFSTLPDLYLGNFNKTGNSSFAVTNYNGTCATAGASVTKVYEATDNTYNFGTANFLTSINAPALGGYGSSTLTFNQASLATGLHYLVLITNYGGTVTESNYPNDTLRVEIAPDLYVSNIAVSNTNVHIGDVVNFVGTINNQGITTAGVSHTGFWADNVLIGTDVATGLSPAGNSQQVISNNYTITSDATGCPLNIKVMADDELEVAESDENNNTKNYVYGVDFTAGAPCGYIGSGCNHYRIGLGTTLNMTSFVQNMGTRDADGCNVQFSLAGTVLGTTSVGHLVASQGSLPVNVTYTFNTYGSYAIAVIADYNNQYCEINENNNVGYIYVDVVGLPDLRILSSDISPSPLNPAPGGTVTFVASVHNIGDAPSISVPVHFIVEDPTVVGGIVDLGYATLPILAPGQDAAVIAPNKFTRNSVGTVIFQARADNDKAPYKELESDTTNNAATRAVIFGAAPDFSKAQYEGITFSSNCFQRGQTVSVREYIRNYGGASASATLNFYFVSTTGSRTLIGSVPFTMNAQDSARISTNWVVSADTGRIYTEIVNSNPQEFNELNNNDSLNFRTCNGIPASYDTVTICSNALPYVWNGLMFTQAGSQTVHLTTVGGGDSTATLLLKVKATTTSQKSVSVCQASLPYLWNGKSITQGGYDTVYLTDVQGCDSIAYLHLTVNQASSSFDTAQICDNALPYSWNGLTFTVPGTQTAHLTNAAGCDSAATLQLSIVSGSYVWTGAVNTEWTNVGNWCSGSVPTKGTNVTIPTVSTNKYPVLPLAGNDTIGNLYIANGASLTLSADAFTIIGNVTGKGIFKGGPTAFLQVLTTVRDTLYFGQTGQDSMLSTFVANGSGTVVLGSGVGIIKQLTVIGGCTLATNNHLTLKGTSIASTAEVSPVLGSITGNVTVERFIPNGKRSYRDLAAGVAHAGTIFSNWQENGAYPSTNGIYITGSNNGYFNGIHAVDATNGFDITGSGLASMYYYLNGNWTAVPNTKTTNLDPYEGYRALVRGDRNFVMDDPIGPTIPLPPPYPQNLVVPLDMDNNATIRTTGQLVTGTVTIKSTRNNPATLNGVYNSSYGLTPATTNDSSYSMVANPYWCPISWSSIVSQGGLSNLFNTYLYLDPTITYTDPTTGLPYQGYVSYNSQSGSSNTMSQVGDYIQPGQAFFVQNDGSGNDPQLVIREGNKAEGTTHLGVFSTAQTFNRLSFTLWRTLPVQGDACIDGSVAVFDNSFSKKVGKEDALKAFNGGGNIFINESKSQLSIDGLPLPKVGDSVHLSLSKLTTGGSYQLKVYAQEWVANGLGAYLTDNFLHTQQVLNGDSTIVSISITTDTASFANRFTVTFKKLVTLPIVFNSITAKAITKGVQVNWSVSLPSAISYYVVERSANGKDFDNKDTVESTVSTNLFGWLDKTPLNGVGYYRIKAVGKDASVVYSNTLSTTSSESNSTIAIYPNPVKGGSFHIQFGDALGGSYQIKMVDANGRMVFDKTIQHSVGSIAETVVFDRALAAGHYTVLVKGSDGVIYQKEVLVE